MMEDQKNALTVLGKIATCVMTEAEFWKSNVAAMLKAQRDEDAALRRAEEAEAKAERGRRKRRKPLKQSWTEKPKQLKGRMQL